MLFLARFPPFLTLIRKNERIYTILRFSEPQLGPQVPFKYTVGFILSVVLSLTIKWWS